jgi:hypothetical protein
MFELSSGGWVSPDVSAGAVRSVNMQERDITHIED